MSLLFHENTKKLMVGISMTVHMPSTNTSKLRAYCTKTVEINIPEYTHIFQTRRYFACLTFLEVDLFHNQMHFRKYKTIKTYRAIIYHSLHLVKYPNRKVF